MLNLFSLWPMKILKALLLIVALCNAAGVHAQKVFASAKYTQMCSYYGEKVTGDIHAFKPDAKAETVIKNIMSVIGLKANFELRAANVPNAAAVVLKGKRYILYNPKFMSSINTVSGSDWAAVSILAHEIGHHLNGHTLDNVGSRPQTELDADEFSGFVLNKLGASLTDAQAVMETIASIKGSHTHPPKRDRLVAIATGWTRANGSAQANTAAVAQVKTTASKPNPETRTEAKPVAKATAKPKQVAVKKQPTRAEKIQQSAKYNNNIASDAYFSSDPKGEYYLTKKGNLVQVDKDKVYMVAKLVRSNKAGYKMMLTDNADTNLYIGHGGVLMNDSGNKVGILRARR